METFKWNPVVKQLVPTCKVTKNGLLLGGYTIDRDWKTGVEVSRTEIHWTAEVSGPVPYIPPGYAVLE